MKQKKTSQQQEYEQHTEVVQQTQEMHLNKNATSSGYHVHNYNVVFTPYDHAKTIRITQEKANNKLLNAQKFLQTSKIKSGATITPTTSASPTRQLFVINNLNH